MLNRSAAANAKEAAETAIKKYNDLQLELKDAATSLYELRKQVGDVLVGRVEDLVNGMADHPKEFDKTFAEFQVEFARFNGIEAEIGRQFEDAALHSGAAAGLGIAAGATTALAAPTAAMAIATTFGTASTGAAISGLSGAAATNAALAWIGGGALATGGGGMAAGNALLALAGPVGWTAAGLCAAGGLVYFSYKNHKITESANEVRLVVEKATHQILEVRELVGKLLEQTTTHAAGVRGLLDQLEGADLPASYRDFTASQLESVGALVNHVRSLSLLINQTVEGRSAAEATESMPASAETPEGEIVPNFILVGGLAAPNVAMEASFQPVLAGGWMSRLTGAFR
jgi:hypothetical protein